MNIGEALKYYRQMKNKTQSEFCGGVISVSFYSKVEHNESRISAEDLLLLLEKNEISLEDFFLIKKNNRKISEDVHLYYYQGDIDKLKDVYKRLSKDPAQKYSATLTKVFIAILLDQVDLLSKIEIDYLKLELFCHENWDKMKLTLLTNIIHLFDEKSAGLMVDQVLKKFDLNQKSSEMQTIFYSLLLNYIGMLIENKQVEKSKHYLVYVKQIQTIPENLFQTMLRAYYEQYLNQNQQQNHDILRSIEDQFCYYGLTTIGETLRMIRTNI
ncbi:hypothetical protein ATZ33_06295 [Enterococcus silesiacus]|uniref:HTH cro/C1-type domain-containing protein n=1 Tax=Enterococcus silesiacus TaxID=332949 RepID=A0A0S3K9L6_9ENTE|nr:helix-turn-helix domain-containing protein [Enterococcus silesiacus]ALS00989.1 hypothetical protein ATZ33_06295 [Enterococcus silesiacus]OJG91786.1 hypothetical protein RV15_GL000453 [Enterococcus silesiacus]